MVYGIFPGLPSGKGCGVAPIDLCLFWHGRFGGQGSRDVEEQIHVLQQDPSVKCIPKSHFTQFLKETLNTLVQQCEAQRDERVESRPIPDLKMTPAGLRVLQDAVEAGSRSEYKCFF